MGLFDNFAWRCNSKDAKDSEVSEEESLFYNSKKEEPIPPADLPRWITVKGYKAVDNDMKSFYGDYQFELNKTYTCDGELIPCQNGFHFCLSLQETCAFFEPQRGRRYFEVKALVPASSYYNKSSNTWETVPKNCCEIDRDLRSFDPYTPPPFQYYSKYIAKEITLTKEIPFEEIKDYIKLPYLTKENYYNIVCHFDYMRLLIQKWHECADSVFSDLFIDYIFTEKISKVASEKTNRDYMIALNLERAIKIVDALRHEKISQEFKVIALLEELSNAS